MLPQNDWKYINYEKGRNKTIYCIGSGPSLRNILLMIPRSEDHVLIVVNRMAEWMHWADIVITSDTTILKNHYGLPDFEGAKIACMYNDFGEDHARQINTRKIKPRKDIIYLERRDDPGLSIHRDRIHGLANSGFGALNLAFLMNPKKIILLGYDFTNHQSYCYNNSPLTKREFPHYERQYNQFRLAAEQLTFADIEVVNGSLISELPFWNKQSPENLI